MKKEQILQKLKNDEDYYGEFGNQFLSNSHVGRLLKDPLNVFKKSKPSPAFLVGVDLNQKGMQTAQQFGAASTYGKKYALGNLLLIDDTEDADSGQKPSKAIDKIKKAALPAITEDQMKKAVEYLAAGGDITAISKKYKLTDIQSNKLVQSTIKSQTKLNEQRDDITKA